MWQPADFQKPRSYQKSKLETFPEDWKVFADFDWNREIIVEVGAGTGFWSETQAQENPDQFFIAIEKTTKLESETRLPNLIKIRANAIELIAHSFPEKTVSEFTFWYPNPNPKKRQANKRFFVSPAFEVFHRALKPGGKIFLASNIKEYVEEAQSFLKEFWEYQVSDLHIVAQSKNRTAFEKKYLERGEDCWEIVASKAQGFTPGVG